MFRSGWGNACKLCRGAHAQCSCLPQHTVPSTHIAPSAYCPCTVRPCSSLSKFCNVSKERHTYTGGKESCMSRLSDRTVWHVRKGIGDERQIASALVDWTVCSWASQAAYSACSRAQITMYSSCEVSWHHIDDTWSAATSCVKIASSACACTTSALRAHVTLVAMVNRNTVYAPPLPAPGPRVV